VSFPFGKRTLNLSLSLVLSPSFSRELREFSVNSVSVAKEEDEEEEEED
jgi:hypothetical protein